MRLAFGYSMRGGCRLGPPAFGKLLMMTSVLCPFVVPGTVMEARVCVVPLASRGLAGTQLDEAMLGGSWLQKF